MKLSVQCKSFLNSVARLNQHTCVYQSRSLNNLKVWRLWAISDDSSRFPDCCTWIGVLQMVKTGQQLLEIVIRQR